MSGVPRAGDRNGISRAVAAHDSRDLQGGSYRTPCRVSRRELDELVRKEFRPGSRPTNAEMAQLVAMPQNAGLVMSELRATASRG